MFYALGRLLFHATNATALIAGILVTVMMLQITVDVVGRYILNAPLPATLTFVSQYYMLFIVFLPLALPERTNSHISVEIVTEKLPSSVQYHLANWVHLFSAAVYAAIGWAAWGEALAKLQTGATVIESGRAIPIWPGYFVLPAGCLLMMIVLLYRFLVYLTGKRSGLGESPVPGAAHRAEPTT